MCSYMHTILSYCTCAQRQGEFRTCWWLHMRVRMYTGGYTCFDSSDNAHRHTFTSYTHYMLSLSLSHTHTYTHLCCPHAWQRRHKTYIQCALTHLYPHPEESAVSWSQPRLPLACFLARYCVYVSLIHHNKSRHACTQICIFMCVCVFVCMYTTLAGPQREQRLVQSSLCLCAALLHSVLPHRT